MLLQTLVCEWFFSPFCMQQRLPLGNRTKPEARTTVRGWPSFITRAERTSPLQAACIFHTRRTSRSLLYETVLPRLNRSLKRSNLNTCTTIDNDAQHLDIYLEFYGCVFSWKTLGKKKKNLLYKGRLASREGWILGLSSICPCIL